MQHTCKQAKGIWYSHRDGAVDWLGVLLQNNLLIDFSLRLTYDEALNFKIENVCILLL